MTMASAGAIWGEYLPNGGVQWDMLHQAMRLASHRHIVMAIEMAREGGAFFSVVNFLSCITVAKRPCYG